MSYYLLLPKVNGVLMEEEIPSITSSLPSGWGLELLRVTEGRIENRTSFSFPTGDAIRLPELALSLAVMLDTLCGDRHINAWYTFNPEKWLIPLIHLAANTNPSEELCACVTKGRVTVVSLVSLMFPDPRIISLEDRQKFTLGFVHRNWCREGKGAVSSILEYVETLAPERLK
jgi:hypothetical protein